MSLVAPTGTKTAVVNHSPNLTGAALTTIYALPVESLTVAQYLSINDRLKRIPHGYDPTVATIGSLLT